MSAEPGLARQATSSAQPLPVIEAQDLEIVLPSGAGVGPWSGTVSAGEQVLLLGPSGSGKSTLLRTLAGAIPSHQRARVTGSVRVGGIDPVGGGALAAAQVLGHLGQDPADGVCLPRLEDDVALPLESRCTPPAQIGQQVQRALGIAGVAVLAERGAGTLSGGELQRAGLAAALVARPRLLLLDEPTAMLDADGVAAVRRTVESAAASGQIATLLIEHRLDDWAGERGVAGLPERTIALTADGRILADGPTAEVLDRHGEALREAGCWLPRELEETLAPARVDGGAAPTHAAVGIAGPRDMADGPARPGSEEQAAVLLTARAAALGHGEQAVLEDVDLEVRAGELLAVVGRNGAGKSTLLGALSRLDPPLHGTVEGAPAGLVFQRPEAQFLAGTVREELAASGASAEQVERMLERLGLREQEAASPFRLSGGQQRRLSIGAMLLGDRPVLLADEPGYGLDRAAQRTVMALLRESAQEGRGVVMTTHDLHSVAEADAVVVIAGGRAHGPMPPHELLEDASLRRRAGLSVVEEPHGEGLAASDAREAGPSAAPEPSPSADPEPSPVAAAPVGPRGALSRRDPTVLLGLLTALSIVSITLTDPAPLLVLYLLLSAGAMLGARFGPLALLRAQLPFAVFATGVLLVNMVSRPGHEPWPELPVRITEEGIVLGTALALRALVIGVGALTVARATDPRSTMVSLQRHARLPARYAYALLAGRRLLDDLPRRWETITRAHRVRLPLTSRGEVARLRPRHLLRCAFALLVDALRSAERLALALELRGLGDGPRTVWKPAALSSGDLLLTAGVAAATVLVLVAF
ncbi:MAG TPA: ATP-binding cassette domain-containing protein [Brachybacterium massiliense]|uniref:ATP-binding cassette domain-containing protein n=1 Tax=Brachybacterium massiliense TaxID=1755098 RepID=A0A921MV95_9MICO|nr:ATP-binding cassette domain-containing protein [Brachybacterium massiliense]